MVESGGKEDFFYAHTQGMLYPPTQVNRVLHDGDTVSRGGGVLTALLFPRRTTGVPRGQ